VHTNEISIRI